MTLSEEFGHHPSRRARLLAHLDVTAGRGLEIGPLDSPIASKEECDVMYVDIHHAEGLRDFYSAHPGFPVEDIIEVDVALIQEGRTRSLAEAIESSIPRDWVVASHVIEHVPDVIGWLKDVADVIVDGGRLSLAVPDRRYCFDARRPATTVGEMLLAHYHRDERPSVRAVFDHFHEAVRITPQEAWQSGCPGRDKIIFPLAMARDMVRRSVEDGTYIDCHVWLFTPRGFVRQVAALAELGHVDFTVMDIAPTAVNDMEFFATLQRIPRAIDEATRAEMISSGFDLPSDSVTGDPTRRWVELSHIEQRLIEIKRQVMGRLRGIRSPH